MTVKIVTDSTSDLSYEIASEFNITVVPAYLRFGSEVYRDRIDINEDQFYRRLLNTTIHPTTEPPTPEDFADTYVKLAQDAEGIVSIHISSKLSATYNAALRGKELAGDICPIWIIDSQLVTMALGLLAIEAATTANLGKNMSQVVEHVEKTIPRIHILGLFDSLKYLALGGRIGRAKALLGSFLNIKPVLTIKDGEIEPVGQVHNRNDGLTRLVDFVKRASQIDTLAIGYSTIREEAENLAKSISSIFPLGQSRIVRLGPVLGVHGGPGLLFVALNGQIY